MRRWIAASLLVVAALYGWVARQPIAAALVAAILVVPLATSAHVALGKAASRAATVAAVIAGAAAGTLMHAPRGADVLQKPWTSLALAGLFAGAVQALLQPPRRRDHEPAPLALLPGLVALMASGETAAGPVYAVAVLAWLALGLAALRAGDAGRAAAADLPRDKRVAGFALLALAAALAAGSIVGLPPLSRWMEHRIIRALGGAETGFSDRMWLGSLDGLLDSEEVVMRVEGPRPDYLRGVVFDHYEIGRWGHRKPSRVTRIDVAAPHAGEGRVRLTVVAGARDRYFLPLGASAVTAGGATLAVNRFGVLRVGEGLATEVSFATSGPPTFAVEPPTEDDLDVPPALRRTLLRIAQRWTTGASTPEEKLAAIVARLGTFTYSRTFERKRADPILDFLIDDKRGHCEYFATATALLARSVGVPARVVAGYRVAEQNAVGGYWVVREKNAHAWAEVWLPGRGFVTVDATPPDLLAQNAPHRTRWVSAMIDVVAVWSSRTLARVTLLDLVYLGLGVLAVGLVIRQIQRLPRRRAERASKARAAPPPPSLLRLLGALARRGLARGESEPIERFATRVEREGALPLAPGAAALLRRWAALRYGGVGDGDALARESDAWVEELGAR